MARYFPIYLFILALCFCKQPAAEIKNAAPEPKKVGPKKKTTGPVAVIPLKKNSLARPVPPVKKDLGGWDYVGNPGLTNGRVNWPSLATNDKGTPYVAFSDAGEEFKAKVLRFNGSSWEYVGKKGFSQGYAHFTSLAIDQGILYVAFRDGAYKEKATVMKFNGIDWEYLGRPGFSDGEAPCLSLKVSSQIPYIAYKDWGHQGKITVMRYSNSRWANVGQPGFTKAAANYLSLAVEKGVPYIAFEDADSAPKSRSAARGPFLKVRSGARKTATGARLTVMKFNGRGWENVGQPRFSKGAVNYISLIVENKIPYVSFNDLGPASPAKLLDGTRRAPRLASAGLTVLKFTNRQGWEPVGPAGFSPGSVQSTSLFLDQGILYVAFTQEDLGTGRDWKAKVLRYTGSQWEHLGKGGFSETSASFTIMAISSNTIFVAFEDWAHDRKLSVMRYGLK